MAQEDNDVQRIKELIEIMKENKLVELEIKHGDDKIFLKRSQGGPPALTAVPVVAPAGVAAAKTHPEQAETTEAPGPQEQLTEIKSPIVGTFYTASSPDSEPFVEIGSAVDQQTVVCIVEAMKVMNEIRAETSGTIAEIVVENGQAVEYGQVLFRVKPD
ncbi:MAG: acetyl-CoA carboxylase biotin carboxyl carrier protein [Planctomycetota bacterium]|jgi:acetyl-CoA carboxylase biotin carboxyl carrier protein